MKKLLSDLLKSPSGKYSRKSIIIMVTFVAMITLGCYIVIDETPNTEAKDIFNSLLFFIGSSLGISVVDKKWENKNE